MKNLLILLFTLFFFQLVDAQEQISKPQDKIYQLEVVDVKPEFPGGIMEFNKFVAKNFKTPEVEGLNGKIITTFVIETDGSISDIKVLQDIGYGSAGEVVKVLTMSKKWIPAKLNDVPVRVLYQFPITIRSAEKYSRKSNQ